MKFALAYLRYAEGGAKERRQYLESLDGGTFSQDIQAACDLPVSAEHVHSLFDSLGYWAARTQLPPSFDGCSPAVWRRGLQQWVIPEILTDFYSRLGGIARGSWGKNEKLDGPFYRFVRVAYSVIPPSLQPKSPDALCRLCKVYLREARNSNEICCTDNVSRGHEFNPMKHPLICSKLPK